MHKMNTIAITLFIFTACSLHLVFLIDPDSSSINGDPLSVPVTEINPPNNNNTSGDASSSDTPKSPAVNPTELPPAGDEKTTTGKPIPVSPGTPITTPTTPPTPPSSSTTQPPTTPPTTSTEKPTTASTTKPTTTTVTPSTSTSTAKPTSPSTTTAAPTIPTTAKPTAAPPTTPTPSHRRFDGPSFIGGIVLALGLVAIGFVAFKFYKARTELNYHTL